MAPSQLTHFLVRVAPSWHPARLPANQDAPEGILEAFSDAFARPMDLSSVAEQDSALCS